MTIGEDLQGIPTVDGTPPVLRASNRLASTYFDIRDRVVGAAVMMTDQQLAKRVPACPGWTVHGLVTHLASMPMTIVAGDIPDEVMAGEDPNPWLARLVEEHADRSICDLARWWASEDEALAEVLRGAGLLLADLITHEGDLHGAIGSRAHRNAPEYDAQIDAALAGVQKDISAAGLPPICVCTGTVRRCSADGEPGWTLRTSFWEAHRALNGRRTREELLAIDHDGDPSRYFEILHNHLPLPNTSLGES
ncbi:MAG: hypothetical protein OEW42_02970 [Acidimicrobiia bacterium]|nr:hypothetical protein [Acidimicrobiia bacterium]